MFRLPIVLLALAPLCSPGGPAVVRTARELMDVVNANETTDIPFEIEGEVIRKQTYSIILRDRTGLASVCRTGRLSGMPEVREGYRLRATGVTGLSFNVLCAAYTNLVVLACGEPTPIPKRTLTPTDLVGDAHDFRPAALVGTVCDVFGDDIDPSYVYLLVGDGTNSIYATMPIPAKTPFDGNRLIGCTVELDGLSAPRTMGVRHCLGRTFQIDDVSMIRVLKREEDTLFSVPELEPRRNSRPSDIALLGRRRITGLVTATWDGSHVMLQTGNHGNSLVAHLTEPKPPRIGDTVEVSGIPATDLYRINLRRARWRPAPAADWPAKSAQRLAIRALLVDEEGRSRINARMIGKAVTVSGEVMGLSAAGNKNRRMYVQEGGYIIPVDIGNCPQAETGLSPGCKIEVTGVCVTEAENWQPDSIFPVIKDIFIVARDDGDIAVRARPPWWTPGRLLAVISALIAGLFAALLWNVSLRHLAERRGRELADEQVRSVSSELKVYERTHLAVELHDSLSQTLAGVSMQIDAVKRFAGTDPARMGEHLGIAAKTLKSCRDELRNCLLDLRSNALEEDDMNGALRKTLEPCLDDADVAIRFFVPREILSDNTAHTILRIVRELVVNAIRHGHADKIRVAGSIEGGKLMFSVRDNGRGFDTERAPGIAEGHFGLQGIRERVDEIGGTFEIASEPGRGAKATVEITLPRDV